MAEKIKKENKNVVNKTATPETVKSTANAASGKKIAVVLVRGFVDVWKPIKDTFEMLRLNRKNYCVIIEDNPPNRGMLNKVKDYVTWGPISKETMVELVAKRGEEFKARTTDSKEKYSYKTLEFEGKKYKPYFRLNPPRKGFGRKGIKMPFNKGGALGSRGEKMNDLVLRML